MTILAARARQIADLQKRIRSANKSHKPRAALYGELRNLVTKQIRSELRAERKEARHA